MKIRYIIIYLVIIILSISIPTIIKISNNHYNKTYQVIEKEIMYAATLCYRDNVCKDDKITLQYLIANNYLDKPVDPKTNKYYDENYYIINEKGTITFYK